MNRITICFCVFGIFTFFNQEMLFIASEDILSGLKLPTSTILICSVAPLTITKIIAPWFIQKIPYVIKVFFVALCMTLGLSLIVFVEDIKVKLVGIALNSVATGTSEVTFLGLTSFYPQTYISAFVAGTGITCLVSPLYYTGITTWTCCSPKTAIMAVIPLPLLLLVFYAILYKNYVSQGSSVNSRSKEPSKVEYTIIPSTPEIKDQFTADIHTSLCGEKMTIGVKILPYIIPLFVSFFAEYLSNSSVITTIVPDSNVHPRDHFLYYFFSYEIGKFLGRSHLFILSCLPSNFLQFLKCKRTWLFAVVELAHLLFFVLESWYHFLWYMWIIVFLCFTLGLVAGMLVLHSPHAVTEHVAPEEKEFALGLLTIGNAVGGFVAGLLGLVVEPYLRGKCREHFTASKEFCFTRPQNATGWDSNIHC